MATNSNLKKFFTWLIIIGFLYAFYVSFNAVEFSPQKLIEGGPNMLDFLKRMFPPNLAILDKVFREVMVTIELAFVGTTIAMIISIPLGFLAATNVVRNRFVVQAVRFLLNADRAIDALILALFFVSAVGLGPFPGTLAVAIHSVGMLGQLMYQAIESVDQKPVEAMQSVGANHLNVIRWGILPQVLPYFLSYYLLRFELNIRAAVVLGIVGAGGIGFLLQSYMRLFQYQNVATVVLTILVLVMAIDYFSSRLRARLV
ncbi:MAG: phosphonate ABC transporter, permease protein PhnE [Bdellovibrionota bacterium]